MLLNTRNTVQEKLFPSLDKEGWTRPQENIAKRPCWERTGWFVQTTDNRWLEPTTPSARAKVASRNLLDRAATPPYPRRGIRSPSNRSGVGEQPLTPVAKIVSPLRGLALLLIVALSVHAAVPRLIDAVKNRDKAAIRTLLQQRVDV